MLLHASRITVLFVNASPLFVVGSCSPTSSRPCPWHRQREGFQFDFRSGCIQVCGTKGSPSVVLPAGDFKQHMSVPQTQETRSSSAWCADADGPLPCSLSASQARRLASPPRSPIPSQPRTFAASQPYCLKLYSYAASLFPLTEENTRISGAVVYGLFVHKMNRNTPYLQVLMRI